MLTSRSDICRASTFSFAWSPHTAKKIDLLAAVHIANHAKCMRVNSSYHLQPRYIIYEYISLKTFLRFLDISGSFL